jgi:RIO kinase 1
MGATLEQLVEDGIVDEVMARLKSGKEADVWLVRHGDKILAAKIYKDRAHRSFKNNAGYKEGRQVRDSRMQRAMDRGSRFGQAAAEEAWKAAESDALHKLFAAGVRVPEPVLFYEGVLVMNLAMDAEGNVAPRLIDAFVPPEVAQELYEDLRGQAVKMLACDLIHGDLSPYNVLLAAEGPTVIDFPQVVSAAHNSTAEGYFKRDLENLRSFFGGADPALLERTQHDAAEIWHAYVRRELTPDFVPTGKPPPGRPQQRGHQERAHQERPHQERSQAQPHGRPQGQQQGHAGPRPERGQGHERSAQRPQQGQRGQHRPQGAPGQQQAGQRHPAQAHAHQQQAPQQQAHAHQQHAHGQVQGAQHPPPHQSPRPAEQAGQRRLQGDPRGRPHAVHERPRGKGPPPQPAPAEGRHQQPQHAQGQQPHPPRQPAQHGQQCHGQQAHPPRQPAQHGQQGQQQHPPRQPAQHGQQGHGQQSHPPRQQAQHGQQAHGAHAQGQPRHQQGSPRHGQQGRPQQGQRPNERPRSQHRPPAPVVERVVRPPLGQQQPPAPAGPRREESE